MNNIYVDILKENRYNTEVIVAQGPKGDPGSIENIDQTYSPTSQNAQSGTAVAEAVEAKADLNYVDNTFSNALKGRVSGEAVSMRDVSPVSHEMTVKVRGENLSDLTGVKVTKVGKNLFDKDNPNKINGYFSADGDLISPAPSTRSIYLACKPNTAYTASKITSARFALGFTSEVPAGGVEVNGVAFSNSGATTLTSTSPADAKYLVVWFYHQSYDTGITEDEIMNSIQVELGPAATEYEAYIPAVEYTPESDGTVDGVMSLYPNTTLMTDTAGAIIDCEYNRDINKAYEGLLQKVAALEAAALNNV